MCGKVRTAEVLKKDKIPSNKKKLSITHCL